MNVITYMELFSVATYRGLHSRLPGEVKLIANRKTHDKSKINSVQFKNIIYIIIEVKGLCSHHMNISMKLYNIYIIK